MTRGDDKGPMPGVLPPSLIDAPYGLDRRDFLKRLGGGLLVVCGWRQAVAEAQEAAQALEGPDLKRGELPTSEVAAWLHIAGDGAVTVYTGKVEIGQNVRTSLAQGVAEELRVPIESIRLVMGDTAQVPDDVGTFGSLSTPVMFAQLRRASVSAREYLTEEAAQHLGVNRQSLVASDGRVQHEATGRSLTYGELTRGQEIVKAVDDDEQLTPDPEWSVAGKSIPKVNGKALVTGRHRFASDLKRAGMRHGKVLRAPAYGLKLEEVEDAAARALDGVLVVREGEFVGVVARTVELAERAISLLKPTWKGTPVAGTERDLHEHLASKARPGPSDARSRIQSGSLEQGMAEGPVRRSARYTSAYIAHVPLEPRACVAEWEGGKLTVWTGTQVPFGIRRGLAETFGLVPEQVRVIVPDTGSGYGGKHSPENEIAAARLARGAGCPVRLAYTREEEFTQGYFRPAGVADVTAGANADGKLRAWEFHNTNSGVAGLDIPYEVEHRLCQFHPSDSPLRQGSYRALASTFNHFARESMIDELARACQVDPLTFRLQNLGEERLREALVAAAERFEWADRQRAAGRGFGLAAAFDKGAALATCVEVEVEAESRQVLVRRVVTSFGPGAIVNPDHMACQVEGSVLMALGGALFEQVEYAGGKLRNPRLSRYRVPRFTDLPQIEVVLLDRRDIKAAGGGEIGMVCVAPAIANAIEDATGVRLRSIPLVPDGWTGQS